MTTILVCRSPKGEWEVRVKSVNWNYAQSCNSLQSAKYEARRLAALYKGAKVTYPV